MPRVCDLVRLGEPADLTHPQYSVVRWMPVGNDYALCNPETGEKLPAEDLVLLDDEWEIARGPLHSTQGFVRLQVR